MSNVNHFPRYSLLQDILKTINAYENKIKLKEHEIIIFIESCHLFKVDAATAEVAEEEAMSAWKTAHELMEKAQSSEERDAASEASKSAKSLLEDDRNLVDLKDDKMEYVFKKELRGLLQLHNFKLKEYEKATYGNLYKIFLQTDCPILTFGKSDHAFSKGVL